MEFTLSPLAQTPDALTPGPHRLTIDNRHLPALGVYLINAASPALNDIKITQQTRSANQNRGEIEFAFHPPAEPTPATARVAAVAALIALAAGAVWLLATRR